MTPYDLALRTFFDFECICSPSSESNRTLEPIKASKHHLLPDYGEFLKLLALEKKKARQWTYQILSNAYENRGHFAMIVPLRQELHDNTEHAIRWAINRRIKDKDPELRGDLKLKKLLPTAEKCYREEWNRGGGRACGLVRLGFYNTILIYPDETDPNELLEASSAAILYGRNCLNPDPFRPDNLDNASYRIHCRTLKRRYPNPLGYYVVENILDYDLLPLLRFEYNKCPVRWITKGAAFSLLRTLSGFLAEHAEFEEASRIHQYIKNRGLEPQDFEPSGALVRRRGMVDFLSKWEAYRALRCKRPGLEPILEANKEALRRNPNDDNLKCGALLFESAGFLWTQYPTNRFLQCAFERVDQALALLKDGSVAIGEEERGALNPRGTRVTPWNIQEACALGAALTSAVRPAKWKERVNNLISIAEKIRAQTGYQISLELPNVLEVFSSELRIEKVKRFFRANTKPRLPRTIIAKVRRSVALIDKHIAA